MANPYVAVLPRVRHAEHREDLELVEHGFAPNGELRNKYNLGNGCRRVLLYVADDIDLDPAYPSWEGE